MNLTSSALLVSGRADVLLIDVCRLGARVGQLLWLIDFFLTDYPLMLLVRFGLCLFEDPWRISNHLVSTNGDLTQVECFGNLHLRLITQRLR